MKKIAVAFVLVLLTIGQTYSQISKNVKTKNMKDIERPDHYTFQLSDKLTRQKVTFKNRYGITLAGDLYVPKNNSNKVSAALAISGPLEQ
jgi:hypothetical protein